MTRVAWAICVLACLLGARPSHANPNPMTRQQIADIAKTVVGFSYWWGGAKWLPGAGDKGKCIPKGSSGCPNCSHTGAYGADCSGLAGKAWQVDKPTPLDVYYHPYSTYNFVFTTAWWTHPPKGEAKLGDELSHHSNGAGHIFVYEKGNPWGSVYAWECKGCSYGCVYNLRSVSSEYVLVRRVSIVEPAQCKKHCEGTAIVGDDCGKGDCAAFGATCVDDDLGVRCVSVFCPAKGTTSTCLPDAKNGKIATCTNGSLSAPGDCGVYGAICSTAVPPKAKCVSGLCATGPKAAPKAGDLCYDNKHFTCLSNGDLKESPCPTGSPCQTLAGKTGPGSGSCGPKPCGSCDDGNPCTDDSCNDGTCDHKANTKPCDDKDLCTIGDVCSDGGCGGDPKNCDDGFACTADTCAGGTCAHNPSDPECDDGTPCTADKCTDKGCVSTPQDGPCDDGDGCTVGGGCKNGACAPGSYKQCDDDNTCSADSCKDGTCVHDPLTGNCDDGDACTIGDYCAGGLCLAGATNSCDDGVACSIDSCADGKCVHKGDPDKSYEVCDGNNVAVTEGCLGKIVKTTPCPANTTCDGGVCKTASELGKDTVSTNDGKSGGTGDGLGAVDSGSATKTGNTAGTSAGGLGCNARRGPGPGLWALLACGLVLAWRRKGQVTAGRVTP